MLLEGLGKSQFCELFPILLIWLIIRGAYFTLILPTHALLQPCCTPPALCWFPAEGPKPLTFANKLDLLRDLNSNIEAMNLQMGQKVPNFPTLGIRTRTKKLRTVSRHRKEHWQGETIDDKMVLTDDQRIKMGRQIWKFFFHSTDRE